MIEKAYIALGANIAGPWGTPRESLQRSLTLLEEFGRITAKSAIHETEPVGFQDQPKFLNAVIALETQLEPEALLQRLLDIERSLGRDRSHGIANGPRTMDLDLLLYGDRVQQSASLQLPHPRLAERAFVLVPLEEIAPELIHPISGKSVKQLRKELDSIDLRDKS